MIDPKEFREGNYFRWSVLASMGKGVEKITPKNHYQYSRFRNPIKITEDELKMFGWVQDEVFPSGHIRWRLEIKGIFTRVFYWKDGLFETGRNGTLVTCKFVHQMQNIYFILQGGELEIKKQ